MKVLVIDRDAMFASFLAPRLQALGHDVITTTIKNDGIEHINASKIDVVFFDPAPMIDPKSLIVQIKRMVHTYPYLIQISSNITRQEAIRKGCNDGIEKPIYEKDLVECLQNAERMCSLVARIGDESYDFPSSGGVISKSAFNQLFRSAIDRVTRYGETAHTLLIKMANYEDIKLDDGKYAADYAVSKLAQNLVRLRRQSDILAQIAPNEYALLLQRPQNAKESIEAAKRFFFALDELGDISSNGTTGVALEIKLVQLPTGILDFDREGKIQAHGAVRAG